MFILVKFGNNETLICNPDCAVINLLTSIKSRAGYGNTNVVVDLSDETGLIKALSAHKYEQATKYLDCHATYVLLQKEPIPGDPSHFTYSLLIESVTDLSPDFQLHEADVELKKARRLNYKTPSPAGRLHAAAKPKKHAHRASAKRK